MLDHIPSRVLNLAFNAGFAAGVPRLDELRAVFGDRSDFQNLPLTTPAEFSADLAHGSSAAVRLRALHSVSVLPTAPKTPSGPLTDRGVHRGPRGTERWYFINGILTDAATAESNAAALSAMFQRPISVLYNTTKGLISDLLECAVGKGFEKLTEAVDANIETFVC